MAPDRTALIAAAERLRGLWYGYPPGDAEAARRIEREPVRRRRYSWCGYIVHSEPGIAPQPVPPTHADGRARLRAVLEAWRTPAWTDISGWDDSRRGPVRRLLVVAGKALKDETDDAVERADFLVQRVVESIARQTPADRIERYVQTLAALPSGTWRIDLCGKQGLKADPPPQYVRGIG